MITYSTFANLNDTLKNRAPKLYDLISPKDKRLDWPHLDRLVEQRGMTPKWIQQNWWPLVEYGTHTTPEQFFDGFIPGWQNMSCDFVLIMMDSYSTGRIYELNAKDLPEFHHSYANHSGNQSRFFQGPGDYLAIDLNEMTAYALMHEGYSTIVKLE